MKPKGVRRLFHDLQIKNKLFISYFLVSIIPVAGLGYFSYNQSVQSVEQQSLNLIYQLQQNTIASIEQRLNSYVFLANTIYDNQRIQNLVSAQNIDYYEEFNLHTGFLEPALQSMLNATGKGIYLALMRYNDHGSEILPTNFENIAGLGEQQYDYLDAGGQFYQIINYDRVKHRSWFQAVRSDGHADRYVWQQVGEDLRYGNISLLREMVNYADYTNDKIGMLRLTVKLEDILGREDVMDSSEKGFNLIFGKEGSLLSMEPEKSVFLQQNRATIDALLTWQDNPASRILDDRILVRGELSDYGWQMVSVFPIRNITDKVGEIRNATLIYGLLTILFLFVITFMLSASFSRRIKTVIGQMQIFKKGNFAVRIDEVGKDEFGILASVFNNMAERLELLIKDNYQANLDKKDAQLHALQAQINPHFLYNSMSSISRLAEVGENDKIVVMVKSLVLFYRMTLNNGRDLIRIGDELAQVNAYLEIYRIRKGEFFRVTYRISDHVLNYYTVKVILQPFAENIFEHAMDGSYTVVHIRIEADEVGDDVVFTIADDGAGMTQRKLESLFAEEGNGSNGYGIKNVDERIKLQFGARYGVTVHSVLGEGTTVTLTIPKLLCSPAKERRFGK